MTMNWQFQTAAVDALMIQFAPHIDLQINAKVHQLATRLRQQQPDWLREVVPSYRSLLLYYDVLECNEAQVKRALKPVIDELMKTDETMQLDAQHHVIEVCYDPELAADLETVAEHLKGSVDDVVHLHTAPTYHVYTLGFAPGFAYLGDVDERLRLPRHATPRQKVPRGSVAIAEQQTAIYPRTSPGGWQLIGRAAAWPELQSGDTVSFKAITRQDYERLCADAEQQYD
ncbi:5-oxoprolinase subunit PxpB [Pseudidiomarina sp. 1APP75-32.1]|uniref:5-oxoprolinase subunit PxpB n=1 Tax=Pseudidiomarina terrestris TaxID=2820060 RepID=A0AAW7QWD6_9GAMM|nr:MULTISPECIES: 5-oxoprolinase subunit PxpB [unclassified Pseudidiomarina]MDN7124079.1 5-oxoprolinase subunit PxpB [Pseudidiomarina sp. 1APP75-32.1]MDN7128336.1 5-oxoprolinase subunit PxpB [Pseudidiomarina sp. 1APR75-15]